MQFSPGKAPAYSICPAPDLGYVGPRSIVCVVARTGTDARGRRPRIALAIAVLAVVCALMIARLLLGGSEGEAPPEVPGPRTEVARPATTNEQGRTGAASSPEVRSAEASSVPSAPLVGSVVDESGRPIVDAEVVAGPRALATEGGGSHVVAPFDEHATRSARTASDGSFRIEGLALGRVDVAARAPGRASASRTDVVLDARENAPIRLELRPGRVLEGTVVDARGAPIAGAEVTVDVLDWRAGDAAVGDALRRSVHGGSDGRFRIDGLMPGRPLRAVGHAFGFLDGGEVRVEADAAAIVLRLESAPFLEIRAVDAITGAPIDAAKLEITWDSDADDPDGGGRPGPTLLTGEEADRRVGRALPPGSVVAFDLRGRSAMFRVASAGFATAHVEIADLEPGEARPRRVELEPEAWLTGRVVRADGAGQADVLVAVRDLGNADARDATGALVAGNFARADPLSGSGPRLRPETVTATTDEAGRFELRGLGDGEHRVGLRIGEDDGLVEPMEVELARGANELPVITLPARATIECVVFDAAGAPVPGLEVRVIPFVEGSRPSSLLETLAEPIASSTTDARGAARIEWLEPGRVVVRVRPDGATRPEHDGRAELDLAAGSSTAVTIRLPAR